MRNYTLVFDLDGTLADTSKDILDSLERTLINEKINYSMGIIKPYVSDGAIALINMASSIAFDNDDPNLLHLKDAFINHYQDNICNQTTLYPFVKDVLSDLGSGLID